MEHPRIEMTRWINGATMGHVDHGKSTLLGCFLIKIGEISKRDLDTMIELATDMGKPDMSYALLMDRLPEERRRGLSIETGYVGFSLGSTHIMLIDNPGHEDFISNLISGTSQADFGILLIASDDFEQALGEPTHTLQSKRVSKWRGLARIHASIALRFGIESLIVVISKMDLCDYNRVHYENVVTCAKYELLKIGFKDHRLLFLPTAILPSKGVGHNIINKSKQMSWAQYTFKDALARIGPSRAALSYPFRLEIHKIFHGIAGTQRVITGKISSGGIAIGDEVLIMPEKCYARVTSLQMRDQTVKFDRQERWPDMTRACAPMVVAVGIRLLGKARPENIYSGQVLCQSHEPSPTANRIRARLYSTPSSGRRGSLKVGREYAFYAAKGSYRGFDRIQRKPQVFALIEKIERLFKLGTNDVVQPIDIVDVEHLAIVILHLSRSISIDTENTVLPRSRFLLMQGPVLLAGGQVLDILN